MVGPWILFAPIGGVDDMGDLEYIEGKVLASNYFQVSGDINAITDTIEFIVPAGKTAFLIEAKITPTLHTVPAISTVSAVTVTIVDAVKAVLKIDTVVKDTANVGFASSSRLESSGGMNNTQQIIPAKFNVLGLSLVGNGVKKIEIENTLDDGSAFATMSGYLV